jgi:hypothetical protein
VWSERLAWFPGHNNLGIYQLLLFAVVSSLCYKKDKIMNKQKVILVLSRTFMGLSAVSMLMVSMMAFANPQAVMDLVHVKLNNTDAFSSIRGVYGGVGLCLFIGIVYMLWKEVKTGLIFLCMLWGFYALSRIITIYTEGSLGAFGTQWLKTESIFFVIALVLSILHKSQSRVRNAGA